MAQENLLTETKYYDLVLDKMKNNKPVWFEGQKYSVIGMYVIYQDKDNITQYKKINSTTTKSIPATYHLYKFSEFYLLPYSTKPILNSKFENNLVIEIYDLISSDKRKLIGSNELIKEKCVCKKNIYYYQTFETPYGLISNAVRLEKVTKHEIVENNIDKVRVTKKAMKIKLKDVKKSLNIDRKTFLEKNGVTLW